VGNLQVSTGYLRLFARNYLQIQINPFPQVLSDPGRHIRILQIPAGTYRYLTCHHSWEIIHTDLGLDFLMENTCRSDVNQPIG